ncbi:hypothetical protein NL108_009733 [Boleophthalmus pectinirostris]|uniref:signaling threshold-regulating transmembrane adapter 1-like n=1 Tax=Boleophthalmus pectinirostris TaxID=150288 RepID=UPI00242AA90A|nr:signaling threshold-regulating transmembrane adapter 1-like [Boleophthalmus pectinirostris]KAJ0068614.1 hypothetical protein NL108_009733 [Boleophthalmus pectinirostris]
MICCDGKDARWMCDNFEILFGVLVSVLGVSVALNVYFCAAKHCSGRRTKNESKRSRTKKQMEENPIYGNLTLSNAQTDTETPFTSSVRRDQRRITAVSQDCYANLSLQRAPLSCGPSAPPLDPADLHLHLDLEHAPYPEKDPDDAEVRSAVSDLYASVQTRAKILRSPDSEEEYANHL